MVAVGVAPVTVTEALPVALIVGVLTFTVTGLFGQLPGEGLPLRDGDGDDDLEGDADVDDDGLGEAPATTLRQPVHAALVLPSLRLTETSRAPAVASAAATSVARRVSVLTKSTEVTVIPVP